MMPSTSPASRRRGFPAVAPSFEICRPVARPEDVLASHGLHPGVPQTLDPAAGVTLVTWVP